MIRREGGRIGIMEIMHMISDSRSSSKGNNNSKWSDIYDDEQFQNDPMSDLNFGQTHLVEAGGRMKPPEAGSRKVPSPLDDYGVSNGVSSNAWSNWTPTLRQNSKEPDGYWASRDRWEAGNEGWVWNTQNGQGTRAMVGEGSNGGPPTSNGKKKKLSKHARMLQRREEKQQNKSPFDELEYNAKMYKETIMTPETSSISVTRTALSTDTGFAGLFNANPTPCCSYYEDDPESMYQDMRNRKQWTPNAVNLYGRKKMKGSGTGAAQSSNTRKRW